MPGELRWYREKLGPFVLMEDEGFFYIQWPCGGRTQGLKRQYYLFC